jgi:hypothetical protein
MLIQPKEGSGVFPVSLWAIRGVGAGQRLYKTPQASTPGSIPEAILTASTSLCREARYRSVIS